MATAGERTLVAAKNREGYCLWEERLLIAFGNKELWRIFGSKREDLGLTWGQRNCHNDELHYIYTVCPQSPFGVLKNCGAQTN
jgi:hypothetical protein